MQLIHFESLRSALHVRRRACKLNWIFARRIRKLKLVYLSESVHLPGIDLLQSPVVFELCRRQWMYLSVCGLASGKVVLGGLASDLCLVFDSRGR